MKETSRGVLYIAFGQYYVDEAIHSANSLKRLMPEIHVTLFTDLPVSEPCFDAVRGIEVRHKRAKVDYLRESPYAETLYLDSDTEVRLPFSDAFLLLERFDIAAAQSLGRKSSNFSKKVREYDEISHAFPEYNSGVIFFRRGPTMDAFFDLWREKFYAYEKESKGRDQLSFRLALWLSDCRIHTLAPEYNVRSQAHRQRVELASRKERSALLTPRILHWHDLHQPPRFAFKSKHKPYRF